MDLVQETITLLELRLQSIRRQVGPLRRYRAGRNCQKGYNCGGSCITRRKNCRKALKGEAKDYASWLTSKLDPANVAMMQRGGFTPGETAALSRTDLSEEAKSKAIPLMEDDATRQVVESVAAKENDRVAIQEMGEMSMAKQRQAIDDWVATSQQNKRLKERGMDIPDSVAKRTEDGIKQGIQDLSDMETFARNGLKDNSLDNAPAPLKAGIEAMRRQGRSDDEIRSALKEKQGQLDSELPKAKAKSKTKPKQAPDFDPSDTARGDQIKQLNEERAKQRREARAKSANKAEPKAKAKAEPKAKPKTEPKAKAEPKSEPKAKTEPKAKAKPKSEPKAKAKAEPKPPKDQKEFERSLNDIMGDKRAVSVAELRKTGLSDDQIAEFVRKGHENGTLVAQGGEGNFGFNPRAVAREKFGKEFKDLTGAEKRQMFEEDAKRLESVNALGKKIFPGGRKVTEIRRP